MVCFRRKSKFGEFSRATSIFFNQKMDNGFVLRTPKCINPENIIQIGAVLETRFAKISHFFRILHLRECQMSKFKHFKRNFMVLVPFF
jgi:hypothetical protein